jgi:hypothetical protein
MDRLLKISFGLLLFLAGILFFPSCFGVVFKNPQPKGFVDLEQFPDSVCGRYATSNDSTFIGIENKKVIITQYKLETVLEIPANEVKLAQLRSLTNSESARSKKTYSSVEKGDTLFFSTTEINYLSVGKDFLLRVYNKIYFANFPDTIHGDKKDYNAWAVCLLHFSEDGGLYLTAANLTRHITHSTQTPPTDVSMPYMSEKDAAKYFSSITPVKHLKGTGVYQLDPDVKQLQELMEEGFFNVVASYRKIKY